MAILFERIAVEQNLPRFIHWAAELNKLLGCKERRLEAKKKPADPQATP
jgi:hypothetical protein